MPGSFFLCAGERARLVWSVGGGCGGLADSAETGLESAQLSWDSALMLNNQRSPHLIQRKWAEIQHLCRRSVGRLGAVAYSAECRLESAKARLNSALVLRVRRSARCSSIYSAECRLESAKARLNSALLPIIQRNARLIQRKRFRIQRLCFGSASVPGPVVPVCRVSLSYPPISTSSLSRFCACPACS